MTRSEPRPQPPETLRPGARFRVERFLGAVAMAAMCAIALANVLVRYLTDIPFAFTEELSVFLLVFLAFVCAGRAFLDGNRMAIAYFVERLPQRRRRRMLPGASRSAR